MTKTSARSIDVAVALLRRQNGDVLIGERPDHKPYPRAWEFPGGKVEPGESIVAALARELREELRIDPIDPRPVRTELAEYNGRSYRVHFFLVRQWKGTPDNRDFGRLEWVATAAILSYDMLEGNQAICRWIEQGGLDDP